MPQSHLFSVMQRQPHASQSYSSYAQRRLPMDVVLVVMFALAMPILLFTVDQHIALLWNPSIRKFRTLPPLLNPPERLSDPHYTFVYDHFINNYKVFAHVTSCSYHIAVSVFTLGTNSWRMIDDFPYSGSIYGSGMFVSGTVNWLTSDALISFSLVIVSLDLENESYRTLLMPDLNANPLLTCDLKLGVLMDCLCIFASSFEFFDVCVMKEYGIQEAWIKLFSVPYVGGSPHVSSPYVRCPRSYRYTKVVYVYEDDQVLLEFENPLSDLKLVVYNSKNGTSKIPWIRNINFGMIPEVYVESLMSPFS